MNWDKIKEQYPKAIELLDDWVYENHPDIAFKNIFYFLEYFFDEQGIYIDVRPFYYDYMFFICDIIFMDNPNDWQEQADTRTLAEEKAFEQAFSILESKVA